MRKLLSLLVCAAMFIFAGCDNVNGVAKTIGVSAGYVCEMTKVDPSARTTSILVLEKLVKVHPANDTTYVATWKPLINEDVAKLVENKKVNDLQGTAIKMILNVAAEGMDYLFAKHPDWKKTTDLANQAISGFMAGFKSVIEVDVPLASNGQTLERDEEAYEFLKNKFSSKNE